jgi:hypothetical protein
LEGTGVACLSPKESLARLFFPSTGRAARVCRDGGRGADRDPILIAGRVGARGAGRKFVGCWGARARQGVGSEGWARDGVYIHGMSGNQKMPLFGAIVRKEEMRWLGDCCVFVLVEYTLEQMTHVRYWASVRLRLSHRIGLEVRSPHVRHGTHYNCMYVRNIVLHSTYCT